MAPPKSRRRDGSHPPRIAHINACALRKQYPILPLPGEHNYQLTIDQLPEPSRPHILPLRLASPRPANPLRHLRDPNLVLAGGGNPPHVLRPNGLRGAQLPPEAAHQGGKTETYVPVRQSRV